MLRRVRSVLAAATFASLAIFGQSGNALAASSGSLSLSGSTFTVSQSTGTMTITINRTGGSSGKVHAYYGTHPGTGSLDCDFKNTYGHVDWADGDTSPRVITIPISTARPFSGTKTFSFDVSSPTGATLGAPAWAHVTINGSAGASVIAMGSSSYSVSQSAGSVTVSVNRIGGASGAVSVTHTTTNGTAVAGTNFVATSGTLSWANGDTKPKSFIVQLPNSTPFTGTKSFTVALSNPSGGAAISNPGSAGVSITGTASTGSSSAPSVPTNLLMTGQAASSVSLSWAAPATHANSISYYRIYRNGVAYATSTATSYIDYNAPNATNVALTYASTIYGYAVSAVDSAGVEGPKTTAASFPIYQGGVFFWEGDYSYGAVVNYRDQAGAPSSGTTDIAIHVTGQGGGFQPYSGKVVPIYALEAGSFDYVSVDLKPTVSGQKWRLSAISRLPPGDVYPWGIVNLLDYGPAPVVGKWATYKVPLSALSIGKTTFTGSISGSTLTVTSVSGGVGVDAGGFITGNGVKPGTYITGFNANGGPGTYTVYPSQNVASTSMAEQRTGIYKFDIIDDSGRSANTYYVDNFKLTQD